jgi:predicted O-methyltransferase YrrM
MKKAVISILNKLPYIRGLVSELKADKYINRFPVGHYHSPIPDQEEIQQHYEKHIGEVKDIDFDFSDQTKVLEELLPYYIEMPWSFTDDAKNKAFRYKNEGSFYRYSDAVFLYLLMRKHQPKRIIEIGSGFSSAIMLDTNDVYFKKSPIQFTFIEPNPQDRLNGLISEIDKKNCSIHVDKVQNVDLSVYESLEENDILFVDSSHLSKTGSDFNFIMFNILPLLKKGVIIHFHDVFYPFEYPKDWLTREHFYWNECYVLRSFLMNNDTYDIDFFNSAAHKYHKDFLEKNMSSVLIDHEHCGAIWLKKN